MAIYISENSLREVTYENNPIDRVLFPNLDCNNSGNIASAFNPDAHYSQGDYIFYNGKLYKFITDHEGAWDEADVIPVTITDELEKIWENTLIINSAEGAIASFPDGAEGVPVKKLTVEIVPVQDLHGQSSPYPAGGGTNVLPVDRDVQSSTASGITFTINKDDGGNVAYVSVVGTASENADFHLRMASGTPIPLTIPNGDYYLFKTGSSSVVIYLTITGSNSDTRYVSAGENNASFSISSGDVISAVFIRVSTGSTVNAKIYPMISSSSANAYAPYSNICPITGWTEAKVARTGINLWNEQWEKGAYDDYGVKTDSTAVRTANMIPILPNTTYYLKSPVNCYIYYYDRSGNFIRWITGTHNDTFTTDSNAWYINFNTLTAYGITYNHDISINYPSTDHDYHSGANNETYTIDLSTTRYGGTLDVTSGVLTVTHGYVDLGTLTWIKSGTRFYVEYEVSNSDRPYAPDGSIVYVTDAICSQYAATSRANIESVSNGFSIHASGSSYVTVHDEQYNDLDTASFKTAMNGVQLCYELAQPQTVQLDPETVTTLLGQNCIFADCGDVAVEYYANTKLYLENLGTPEEESVATANITNGEYFMIGTNLYIATESIASGETIKVGTNCELTNIADALNELNS